MRISAGLSLKHGLDTIKYIKEKCSAVALVPAITEMSLQHLQWPLNIFVAPRAIFTPLSPCLHGTGT